MSFFDHVSGTPCANCECAPATDADFPFCDPECRDEYNGEGNYAD